MLEVLVLTEDELKTTGKITGDKGTEARAKWSRLAVKSKKKWQFKKLVHDEDV